MSASLLLTARKGVTTAAALVDLGTLLGEVLPVGYSDPTFRMAVRIGSLGALQGVDGCVIFKGPKPLLSDIAIAASAVHWEISLTLAPYA